MKIGWGACSALRQVLSIGQHHDAFLAATRVVEIRIEHLTAIVMNVARFAGKTGLGDNPAMC